MQMDFKKIKQKHYEEQIYSMSVSLIINYVFFNHDANASYATKDNN